ncbi:MAG: hypothetical protein JWQ72_3271 [Polaromonas sp.]|nr:hypothetical protein [Polaromonas sp.]
MRVLPFVGWSSFSFLGAGPALGVFFLLLFTEPLTLFTPAVFLIVFLGYMLGVVPALIAFLIFSVGCALAVGVFGFGALTLRSGAVIGFLSALLPGYLVFRTLEAVVLCGFVGGICGVFAVRLQTPLGPIWLRKFF